VVNRMLIAGCMISTDTEYLPVAEVHVPQMCATPADMQKGCLFARATNYDMHAVQSDVCYFQTRGCTDSTALNYNVDAFIDDGSCISTIKGCTMRGSYDGVDTETPEYRSLFVGSPLRNAGQVATANITGDNITLNYEPSANVLDGCIIRVEGCMDSSAVNYDPFANVNSNTWCVPAIQGCMMPPQGCQQSWSLCSSTYLRRLMYEPLNFNVAATVNDKPSCAFAFTGCMDSLAVNFDARATISDTCYYSTYGCLHPGALNFGCRNSRALQSDGSYAQVTSRCADSNGVPTEATQHVYSACNFRIEESIASPTAAINIGNANSVRTAIISFTSPMSITDVTQTVTDSICARATSILPVGTVSGCETIASAASVLFQVTLTATSQAAQSSVVSSLQSQLSSTAAASALLGVPVATLPLISAETFTPPTVNDYTPVIVGAAVGGTFGGLLLIAGAFFIMRRRQYKVEA